MESSSDHHVHLDLPLDPRHAATARLVGASLGADVGMHTDDIDDLRLGINEAVALLSDVPEAGTARLLVDFRWGPGALQVDLRSTARAEPVEVDDLARRILAAVVDSFTSSPEGVTLTKLVSSDGSGQDPPEHDTGAPGGAAPTTQGATGGQTGER
jgi:hypothetical protein